MTHFFYAEHLIKKRAAFTVDVTMAVPKGTMTVIVGSSGSGKSTILRLIAGLETADSPATRIMLAGTDITSCAPGRRRVGMVFQQTALFPHLSVQDNVAYGLTARGMRPRAARKQADELLTQFGLDGYGRRWPETLSGGEAQRVAVARTLIVQPELILFDEPLSALDGPLRTKLADDIRALQRQTGFTGIWVTHDIAEAERIADRIAVVDRGCMTEK